MTPGEDESSDFTVVVPLFGHPRYFDGRDAIARYREHVLVALEVTPPHMQAFAAKRDAEWLPLDAEKAAGTGPGPR